MRLLWLPLLLALAAPAGRLAGAADARATESISGIRQTAEQPFLPGVGIRSLLGPLQIPNLGAHAPPGGPHAYRLQVAAILASPCLALPQPHPDRVPVPICERLPYDATAPPAVG